MTSPTGRRTQDIERLREKAAQKRALYVAAKERADVRLAGLMNDPEYRRLRAEAIAAEKDYDRASVAHIMAVQKAKKA